MATRVDQEDIIATVEDYLVDNWPETGVAMQLTTRDTTASNTGTEPVRVASLQWLTFQPRQTRANEHWIGFDFRIVCRSQANDPLDASRISDLFGALLRNGTINLTDRADGTTTVGYIQFDEINHVPPTRDARGVRTAACEVFASARAT